MPKRKQKDKTLDLFNPATLEQQTRISRAKAKGHAYNDQIISSVITWGYSIFLDTFGLQILQAHLIKYPVNEAWVLNETKQAIQEHVPEFLHNYFHVFPNETDFWNKFNKLLILTDKLKKLLPNVSEEKLKLRMPKAFMKICGTDDPYIIDRFRALAVYGVSFGHFQFQLALAIYAALASPFIIDAADFILKRIRHKIYDLRYMGDMSRHALTYGKAKDLLLQLKTDNLYKKNYVRYAQLLDQFILVAIVAYSIICHQEGAWPRPELMIFFVTFTFNVGMQLLQSKIAAYQRTVLSQKLQQIKDQADVIFKNVGKYTIVKKEKLADCYIFFQANNYLIVSAGKVNQIVKDILLNSGIEILEYSNTGFTSKLKKLNDKEIIAIKNNIHQRLVRYLHINVLSTQLHAFFSEWQYIQKIFTQNNLLTASTVFEYPLSDIGFQTLKSCFPGCQISRTDNTVVIEGHIPSREHITFGLGRSASRPALATRFTIAPVQPAAKKVVPRKSFFQPAPKSPVPTATATLPIYRWRSGTFNSNEATNAIKPVNTRFGKLFILFALPLSFFPSTPAFDKVKAKIEEGRLANSEKGSQGLQFRPERARDLTKPGQPWFDSFLRYKLLGKLGDARFYAKMELSRGGERLGVFCGGNWTAHKP
jgi:hypothetical protein